MKGFKFSLQDRGKLSLCVVVAPSMTSRVVDLQRLGSSADFPWLRNGLCAPTALTMVRAPAAPANPAALVALSPAQVKPVSQL